MYKKHFFASLIWVALLMMLVVIPSIFAQGQEGDGTITMVLTRDPITLDPQGPIDPSAPVLLSYLYDTLVYQDDTGLIQPSLAESWSAEDDGKTITFQLVEGITFSNGAPLNADAVIFTFQRLQEIAQRSFIYGEIMNIAAFEKVSDTVLHLTLRQPSATLFSALSYPYAAILEPGAVEAAGEDYGKNPVGSGPLMLAEWLPESSLTMVRNPNYNGHRPYDLDKGPINFETMQVRFTVDQAARVSALLTGEVDIAYLSSAPQLERLADNPDFTVLDSPTRGLVFAGFNTGKAPFDNVELRRAVAQAIDKQLVLDIAAEGLGVVVDAPIPPSIFGYDPEIEAEVRAALPYNPEVSRAAVEAAGYTSDNPLTIKILTSTFPTYDTIAEIIQAQLVEVGINASVEVLDFAGLAAAAAAGEYDIVVTRYDWNDPDLLRIYLSEASIGGANRYFYANPELDALTAQGRMTFDPEARLAIYADAQRIIMADVPWIPLHMGITKVVVNNRVQGVRLVNSYVLIDDVTLVE